MNSIIVKEVYGIRYFKNKDKWEGLADNAEKFQRWMAEQLISKFNHKENVVYSIEEVRCRPFSFIVLELVLITNGFPMVNKITEKVGEENIITALWIDFNFVSTQMTIDRIKDIAGRAYDVKVLPDEYRLYITKKKK